MKNLKSNVLTLGIAGALLCAAWNLRAQNEPGRWYLGLDAGLALQQDITLEGTGEKLSFDPGFRIDLGGGVHLSRSWRAQVEVGFIYNSVDGRAQEYFQVPIMVDAIYTLRLNERVSAYLGAGLGGVSTTLWEDGFLGSQDGFTFGCQGILGAKYAISADVELGLFYKLLGTLEYDLGPYTAGSTLSHSILAAFTYKF